MPLYWLNPATDNKFANKHLLVIGGAPTLLQLETAGIEVFEKRIRSRRLNKHRRPKVRNSPEARQLKEEVGTTDIPSNTLIVLSAGGLESLTAEVVRRRYASDRYSIQNGVVFEVTGTGYSVGLVGSVHLGVRPCQGGHEVWHLEGTQVTAMKSMTESGKAQTKVKDVGGSARLQFTPTNAELATARSNLRPVASPASGQPPIWALSEISGVDLSFLED